MRGRKEILFDLIAFEGNLSELILEISQYPWDSDGDLVVMSVRDLLSVLSRYSDDNLSSKELEDWANAIECREDIGFESDNVGEVIIRLSNPILYGDIAKNRIESIRQDLNAS